MTKHQRYDHAVIGLRVEAARVRCEVQVKDLCSAVGLPLPSWYKKTRCAGSTFTLDELGRIADALHAPAGWPFVDWK